MVMMWKSLRVAVGVPSLPSSPGIEPSMCPWQMGVAGGGALGAVVLEFLAPLEGVAHLEVTVTRDGILGVPR